MKENRDDPAMPDRILEEMARETPDMPADFHARWTEAIREEAKQQQKTAKQQESRRQWRYVLSAAAVFVFLIGGTLLTRASEPKAQLRKQEIAVEAAAPAAEDKEAPAAEAEEVPVLGMEAAPAAKNEAATAIRESQYINTDAAKDAFASMAYPAAGASYEAAEVNDEVTEADYAEAGPYYGSAEMEDEVTEADYAAAEVSDAAAADYAAAGAEGENAGSRKAAEEAAEGRAKAYTGVSAAMAMPTEAVAASPMKTKEPTAAPTEAPTVSPTVVKTEAPTAAPTEEPSAAPAEAYGEGSGFVSFLKDLGIFTLKAAGAAAAGVLLGLGIAAIWKKRKNRQKG